MANIYDSVFDGHSAAHSHYVALSETSGEPIFSIARRLEASGAPDDLVESLRAASVERSEKTEATEAPKSRRSVADDAVTA